MNSYNKPYLRMKRLLQKGKFQLRVNIFGKQKKNYKYASQGRLTLSLCIKKYKLYGTQKKFKEHTLQNIPQKNPVTNPKFKTQTKKSKTLDKISQTGHPVMSRSLYLWVVSVLYCF